MKGIGEEAAEAPATGAAAEQRLFAGVAYVVYSCGDDNDNGRGINMRGLQLWRFSNSSAHCGATTARHEVPLWKAINLTLSVFKRCVITVLHSRQAVKRIV